MQCCSRLDAAGPRVVMNRCAAVLQSCCRVMSPRSSSLCLCYLICGAAVLRVCRLKTWPSKWLEGGVAECGGVTRLMMCTWHQHCSICTIPSVPSVPSPPICPSLHARPGRKWGWIRHWAELLYSRSCDGHEQRQWEGRMKIWNTGYCG